MVNTDALKLGALVVLGVLAFVLLGQVIRIVSWMLSYAVLGLLAVGAGYVAYEVYTGWAEASDEESSTWSSPTEEAMSYGDESADSERSVDDVQEAYAEGKLSDAEFEREIERVMDDGDASSDVRDIERELERET